MGHRDQKTTELFLSLTSSQTLKGLAWPLSKARVHCPPCAGALPPWKVPLLYWTLSETCHMPTHTYLGATTFPYDFPVGMLIPSIEIRCLCIICLTGW